MGDDRVYFDSGEGKYVAQSCAQLGKVCEQITKEDHVISTCVDKANVSDGCGNSLSTFGHCEDNTLVICSNTVPSKGKALRIDCGTSNGQAKTCSMIASGYGYDCAITCGEYGDKTVTDFGICDENNHLHYCNQQGEYKELDCAKMGKTCGFGGLVYDCL